MVMVISITAGCGENPRGESSYPIDVTCEGKGTASVTVDGKVVQNVPEGETITITAIPEDINYRFVGWIAVNGCILLPDQEANPLVISMPGGPIEIKARFEPKPNHFITLTEFEHGEVEISIGGQKGNVAREGEVITITAKPYPHSTFHAWDAGVELDNRMANPATFVMPDMDVSIGAGFDPEYLDLSRHFPDENFRKVAAGYDKDSDSRISPAERMAMAGIIYLNVSGGDPKTGEYKPESELISDLTGIEYFTSLRTFICSHNKLTSLDLTANTELEVLVCSDNRINDLNISASPGLRNLFCSNNELDILDLSGNKGLESMWCENNPLASLDISANTLLSRLTCFDAGFTSLNVSKNRRLVLLWCGSKKSESIKHLLVTVKPNAVFNRLVSDGSEIAVYAGGTGDEVMMTEFGPAGTVNGVTVVRAAE